MIVIYREGEKRTKTNRSLYESLGKRSLELNERPPEKRKNQPSPKVEQLLTVSWTGSYGLGPDIRDLCMKSGSLDDPTNLYVRPAVCLFVHLRTIKGSRRQIKLTNQIRRLKKKHLALVITRLRLPHPQLATTSPTANISDTYTSAELDGRRSH